MSETDMTDYAELREEKAATPHNELIAQLLDSRVPKSEREHAAAREIFKLLRERDELAKDAAQVPHELAHRDRQIRELSDALTWTAQRLRDVLARRPVRDATECLANADRLTGSNRLSCMNQEDSHADSD